MSFRLRSASIALTLTVGLLSLPVTSAQRDSVEEADLKHRLRRPRGPLRSARTGRSGAKVLVIDEASIFGGHAIMSEGELNIVDSPLQRAQGIKDSPDLAFADFTKWGKDNDDFRPNPPREMRKAQLNPLIGVQLILDGPLERT
jgi:hypothetical protein